MKLRVYFLLLAVGWLFMGKVAAHPYHVSIAEVKYNAKTQNLEVALKIFTDDLEETLSDLAQKPLRLSQTAEIKKYLEAYLQTHFRLENGAKKAYPQRLLGFETEADAQWLFLEIPVKPADLKQAKLRNQVLFQTFPDQMNLTNLELNGRKRTLVFKEGQALQALF